MDTWTISTSPDLQLHCSHTQVPVQHREASLVPGGGQSGQTLALTPLPQLVIQTLNKKKFHDLVEILWISREELISPQVSFQMRLNWVLHKKNSRCCAGKVYSLLQLCDWARKDSWMRLCPGPHFQQEVKCCMRDGNIPHTFGAPRAADPSSSVQFCSGCLSAFHLFFLLTLQSLRWRGCIFFFYRDAPEDWPPAEDQICVTACFWQ